MSNIFGVNCEFDRDTLSHDVICSIDTRTTVFKLS